MDDRGERLERLARIAERIAGLPEPLGTAVMRRILVLNCGSVTTAPTAGLATVVIGCAALS